MFGLGDGWSSHAFAYDEMAWHRMRTFSSCYDDDGQMLCRNIDSIVPASGCDVYSFYSIQPFNASRDRRLGIIASFNSRMMTTNVAE